MLPGSELEARLVALARGVARERLLVGRALEAFVAGGGPLALGFSGVGRYGVERLRRPARWGEEARRLARRLAVLPELLRPPGVGGRQSCGFAPAPLRVAFPRN